MAKCLSCLISDVNYSTNVNIAFTSNSAGCRGWRGICVWTESQRSAGTWPPHRHLNSSTLPQPDSDGDQRNLRLGFYSVSHRWDPWYGKCMMMLTIWISLFLITLTDSGRVLSCGSNAFGQLGIGQKPAYTAEVQIVEVILFSLSATIFNCNYLPWSV